MKFPLSAAQISQPSTYMYLQGSTWRSGANALREMRVCFVWRAQNKKSLSACPQIDGGSADVQT